MSSLDTDKALSLTNGSRDGSTPEKEPCLPGSNCTSSEEAGVRRPVSRSDSVSKRRSRASRYEDYLRGRTGLSRAGLLTAMLVLILLLLCLLVIVALSAAWPTTPHEHLFPVCTHAACLHASAQILPRMNSSASSCDNFWNYACGQWLSTQPLPRERSRWNLAEEHAYKYRQQIHHLVTTLPQPNGTSSLNWKLKYLYDSCVHPEHVEVEGGRPLLKLITSIGGWHVLREFSVHSWDYKHTMVKLHSRFGVSPFFQVGVVSHPRNPNKSMIQIIPAGLHLPDRSYYGREQSDLVPSAYIQFMKDAVVALGAMTPDAIRFGRDIFGFEKRIAEITPDASELQNPYDKGRIVTIRELITSASTVPLMDILQAMFPSAGLNDETEILVPNHEYLNKVSQIISNTDRAALNNYLMWVFAAAYLPYLSSQYNDIINIYRRDVTGAEEPLQRWEMCVVTLQKFMGFALAARLDQSMNSMEKELVNSKVKNMFENIRASIKESLSKATWLDPELQRHAMGKIGALKLQIGFTETIMSTKYLENYYSELYIIKNDLFQNVNNAMEFEVEKLKKRLHMPKDEHRWIDAFSSGNEVTYIPTANAVVVPRQLLVLPHFHTKYPESLLYGGLGVQLASAIAASVLPFGILYNSDGSLMTPNWTMVNQTIHEVDRLQRKMVQNVLLKRLVGQGVANRTAIDTTRHITAVRHARVAMTSALVGLPHVHHPGMETLENEQLFYLMYAQNLCSHTTTQQKDLDATANFHLNSSQLLSATLKELPDFSAAFSCGRSSSHYASDPYTDIL